MEHVPTEAAELDAGPESSSGVASTGGGVGWGRLLASEGRGSTTTGSGGVEVMAADWCREGEEAVDDGVLPIPVEPSLWPRSSPGDMTLPCLSLRTSARLTGAVVCQWE